jgi:predicted SAM-dependent methyltransferase
MNTIDFQYQTVPKFITQGFHSQYIFPVVQKICSGAGVDIGCKKKEWAFPGAQPIDIDLNDEWDAYNLPCTGYDYIFSSHCLEHLDDEFQAVQYWYDSLREGGVLFLYLPHPDCLYWQPNKMPNKLHKNMPSPLIVREMMDKVGFKNIFSSERDLAYSFAVYGYK